MDNYLDEEDQFKDILNDQEIGRIKDPELREIRMKYWTLRRNAFLNESGISDKGVGETFNKLMQQEQEEIKRFKK